jgi:hypothetical protein
MNSFLADPFTFSPRLMGSGRDEVVYWSVKQQVGEAKQHMSVLSLRYLSLNYAADS